MSTDTAFAKEVLAIASKILDTEHVDRILPEVSEDVCTAFGVERLSIYLINIDKTMLVSKFSTGLDGRTELRLPISPAYSVAGYVALHRSIVSVVDAYDDEELSRFDPPLSFLKAIDEETGYRTRQILAAPMLDGNDRDDVVGVVQLINTRSGHPFPRAARDGVSELCEALAVAFRRRDPRRRPAAKTKYDHLVIDGVIAAAELDLAIQVARRKGSSLERILLDEFQVSEMAIGRALSQFYSLPYEPFRPEEHRQLILPQRLKRDYVQNEKWLPVDEDGERLIIVTSDPERIMSSRIVNQVFAGKRAEYRVCTEREFGQMVEHYYSHEDVPASVGAILDQMAEGDATIPGGEVEERLEPDSVTVQIVHKLIVEAHAMGASDVHIEPRPGRGKTRLRFRIDGVLSDYVELPSSHHAKLVARLKIMANLDIANRREPQDGKIIFRNFHPGLDIELRIATIPTAAGKEDVVLRLLRPGKPVPIEQLELRPAMLEALKALMARPHGLFLVCGSTGAGKTTTLHSLLDYLNTPETKIWTAEDPVEITQNDLRQVQVNPKANVTFARALRAFLRADPDVIMVGEMRDRETAVIGIEAALTGHQVLATLHTNGAAESVQRLLEMGMDPFHFADALLGVMGQGLARRLCLKCKKPHVGTESEVEEMLGEYVTELGPGGHTEADSATLRDRVYAEWKQRYAYGKNQFILYHATGCEACRNTGYRGRIGVHELLVASPAIRKKIVERAPADVLLATAAAEGMRTLRQDGIEKVLQGHTDMHEIRAVCAR